MSNNMSISSIKEYYNNLCTKAKEWSAAYYEQDAPVVTIRSSKLYDVPYILFS